MGASAANETMGRLVLFVVILAISATLALSSDARSAVMDLAEYVYEKIAVLFGWEVSDDSKTAIDSTKALACAIDVTAYWSSQEDNDLGDRLSYIADPTLPDAPDNPSLFRKVGTTPDVQGGGFASCVGDVETGWGVFTPTFSAVKTNSGGILGKLSEWSGGDGNKITANLFEGPEDCNIEGIETCSSEDGPDNTYVCSEGDENIVCCEQDYEIWNNIYCCKDGYKKAPTANTCVKMSTADIEGEADDIVRNNLGTAMRFGKTAVVCEREELLCCHYSSASGVEYLKYGAGTCPLPTTYLIGTVDMISCDAVDPPLTMPERNLRCTIKAFELQQDVTTAGSESPWYGKLIGSTLDFGRAWIGAVGDPQYLVYFETFPREAEEAWVYSGWNVLVTAFATGAVLNVGVGGVKVAATGIKRGGIYSIKRIGLKAGILGKGVSTTVAKQELKDEFNMAMSKRITKEFGAKKLKTFVAVKATERKIVMRHIDDAAGDVVRKNVREQMVGTFDPPLMNTITDDFLNDLTILTRGERSITKEVVEEALEMNPTIYMTGSQQLLLRDMLLTSRTELRTGNLISKPALKAAAKIRFGATTEAEFTEMFREELLETYTRLDMEFVRATIAASNSKGKIGIVPAANWLSRKVIKRNIYRSPLDEVVDKYASDIYKKRVTKMVALDDAWSDDILFVAGADTLTITSSSGGLSGSAADEITREMLKEIPSSGSAIDNEYKVLLAAWHNLDDDIVKSSTWERAGTLMKSSTGLPTEVARIPTWKRQVVMASAILGSYIYMLEESKEDKYAIAENKIVLSWPKMYTFLRDSRNLDEANYKAIETKSMNDDTMIQLRIPKVFSQGGMPLYLASPCKADITVSHGTDCKCQEYGSKENILVRFTTHIETSGTPDNVKQFYFDFVETLEEGSSPFCKSKETQIISDWIDEEITPDFLEELWANIIRSFSDFIDDYISLPDDGTIVELLNCPLSSISRTVSEGMEDAISTKNEVISFPNEDYPFDGTIEEYIGDISGDSTTSPLLEDIQEEADKMKTAMSGTASAIGGAISVTTDAKVSTEILNIGESRDGGFAAYRTCTSQGFLEWLTNAPDYTARPCITVSVDSDSMDSYIDSGFSPNFCRINEGQADDMAQVGIEAGVAVGSIALAIGSGGAAVPVILAVGGGIGAVGVKWIDITSRWPTSQGN